MREPESCDRSWGDNSKYRGPPFRVAIPCSFLGLVIRTNALSTPSDQISIPTVRFQCLATTVISTRPWEESPRKRRSTRSMISLGSMSWAVVWNGIRKIVVSKSPRNLIRNIQIQYNAPLRRVQERMRDTGLVESDF